MFSKSQQIRGLPTARSRESNLSLSLRILAGIVIGAGVAGCAPPPPQKAEVPPLRSRPLNSATEQALNFTENKLAVVFAIDNKGNIQPYRRSQASAAPVELPIKSATVLDFKSISLFIFNPKVCWKTSDGDKECITY